MKVAHIFNMANNGFHIVKALRNKGIDVDLILDPHDFAMGLPMWEDLELTIDPYHFDINEVLKSYELPPWMKFWKREKRQDNLLTELLSLIYMSQEYDLLHLHPPSPVYLQFMQKPFVMHESGWIRRLVTLNSTVEKLGRRAYTQAECIVMTNPDTYNLLPKLKYKKEVFIPFVVDSNRYKPMQVPKDNDLLFFHPARLVFDVKGNDKLLFAFSQFIKDGYSAKLRMVDWGWQEDFIQTEMLIQKLKLEPYVEWVTPYSKPALIRAYNEADVIFDQFIVGSGGTTMFEAMSCATPVVIYLNGWNAKCFGEMPPIVNARTIQEIYEAMVMLCDKKTRLKVGNKEREFVIKHNHPKVIAAQYIELYQEILS